MLKSTKNILIIEDDIKDVRLVKEMLLEIEAASFYLNHTSNLTLGLNHINENDIDIILLDLFLPDSNGIDTFKTLYVNIPKLPIIV